MTMIDLDYFWVIIYVKKNNIQFLVLLSSDNKLLVLMFHICRSIFSWEMIVNTCDNTLQNSSTYDSTKVSMFVIDEAAIHLIAPLINGNMILTPYVSTSDIKISTIHHPITCAQVKIFTDNLVFLQVPNSLNVSKKC